MLAELNLTAAVTGCVDPVFLDRASQSLVWLPEHGMGWLNVTDAPYDLEYFAKYEGYADTQLGRGITAARRELVNRFCSPSDTLCDVGIGCGDFLDALGSPLAGGCDINPAGVEWLDLRGLWLDPHTEQFDALTFWDSLEHIPDVHRMIANARRWVFCSLPIVPDHGPPTPAWRHYRPTEHCWYFTRLGFIRWMVALGFDCDEFNTQETLLGRSNIETFVFRRRGA